MKKASTVASERRLGRNRYSASIDQRINQNTSALECGLKEAVLIMPAHQINNPELITESNEGFEPTVMRLGKMRPDKHSARPLHAPNDRPAPLAYGVSPELRREAAELGEAGKHEPKLRENGIPADVLEKLLPGNDVIELDEPVIAGGLGYRFAKRAFDVCATGAALIVLAIPMLVIAAKIKSESPGPVIYAQERVGRGGRPFKVYKFRSMYVDAESRGARWASGDDPRVTPFGRFMRERRIDEVPQFVNILKGDMSLIGPRPERPAFCEEFEKRIHGWHYRTLVRPGISGLAQVTGGYDLLPKEKIVLDLEYIEHRSALLDLKIILRTLGVVRTGEGAR